MPSPESADHLINVIGGIIIGVAQMDLTSSEAATSYTLLTVGDGLVTQIPALIVSTAAGLLVSKSATTGSADKALFGQLGGYPQALGLSSFLMLAPGPAARRAFPALRRSCRRNRRAGLEGGATSNQLDAGAEREQAEARGRRAGAGRRGADLQRPADRPRPPGAGLRPANPDQ